MPISAGKTSTVSAARVVVAISILLVAGARIAQADDAKREYQVKAAFIYNFVQFTQWPDDAFTSADSPFVAAVMGQDPFDHALELAMQGKKIGNHPIVVKQFSSPDDLAGCQLLFVPHSEDERLDEIFRKVASHSILTIGESPKFPPAGGTIRFLLEENKIHFEINLDSAQKARLHISSKLLNLARIYKKD
jgi:hypothetical protein